MHSSIHPPTYLLTYLSVYLSIYLYTLDVCVCVCVQCTNDSFCFLTVHKTIIYKKTVYLTICLSVCLSIYVPTRRLFSSIKNSKQRRRLPAISLKVRVIQTVSHVSRHSSRSSMSGEHLMSPSIYVCLPVPFSLELGNPHDQGLLLENIVATMGTESIVGSQQ
jgi:hypothetical protein